VTHALVPTSGYFKLDIMWRGDGLIELPAINGVVRGRAGPVFSPGTDDDRPSDEIMKRSTAPIREQHHEFTPYPDLREPSHDCLCDAAQLHDSLASFDKPKPAEFGVRYLSQRINVDSGTHDSQCEEHGISQPSLFPL
jgi:hypothetical protein